MLDFVRTLARCADLSGPVLDIGSYIEDGQASLDLRRAFPRGSRYVGVDVLEGPGVDHKCDFLDASQVDDLLVELQPKVIVCLYVLEHVWDIQLAARSLARIWRRSPGAWLIASTHQSQPYHGTANYPDYWRITYQGLTRLFTETGIDIRVLAFPGNSNPSDVVAIRPPHMVNPSTILKRVQWAANCPVGLGGAVAFASKDGLVCIQGYGQGGNNVSMHGPDGHMAGIDAPYLAFRPLVPLRDGDEFVFSSGGRSIGAVWLNGQFAEVDRLTQTKWEIVS